MAGKPGKKPNKIEKQHRVNAVYGWLATAHTRTEVIQKASEKWDVTERTADAYIAEARVLIMKEAEMERPAWIAQALTKLQSYEKKAADNKQIQTAINSLQLQAKLIGLTL